MWSYKDKNKPFKLKLIINRYGYCVVNLYVNGEIHQCRVHRLVAKAFIYNPVPSILTQVNHKDGNKLNNNVSNLEWCTPKENTDHAIATGLRINSGDDFHSSILTEKDVHKICKLLEKNKLTAREIAPKIGKHCNVSMVRNIYYGFTWTHISNQYDLSKHTIENIGRKSNLTEKEVHKICKLLSKTQFTYKKIAKIIGCSPMDVNHIKNGYVWLRVSQQYDFSNRNK